MPRSLQDRTVTAAWPALTRAANAGLDPAAADLTRLTDIWTLLTDTYVEPDAPFLALAVSDDVTVRNDVTSGCHRITHTLTVPLDDLTTPAIPRCVEEWTGKARAFERDFVLWRLWTGAAPVAQEALPTNIPTGWGRARLLHWRGGPGNADDLKAAGITVVTIDEPVGSLLEGGVGVLYRAGGGPVVQRAQDLTLSWLPADGSDAVMLVLHERLRITRANTAVPVTR